MQISFPFRIGSSGRTALASEADHVRELIEQVLFTVPGERVHRPTFGSGILNLVFEPNSAELASTIELLAQAALQQWLADRIDLESVSAHAEEGVLRVEVSYRLRSDGALRSTEYVREV
jgi:uncharacterized protein